VRREQEAKDVELPEQEARALAENEEEDPENEQDGADTAEANHPFEQLFAVGFEWTPSPRWLGPGRHCFRRARGFARHLDRVLFHSHRYFFCSGT
jgi:hypothetical protein